MDLQLVLIENSYASHMNQHASHIPKKSWIDKGNFNIVTTSGNTQLLIIYLLILEEEFL